MRARNGVPTKKDLRALCDKHDLCVSFDGYKCLNSVAYSYTDKNASSADKVVASLQEAGFVTIHQHGEKGLRRGILRISRANT